MTEPNANPSDTRKRATRILLVVIAGLLLAYAMQVPGQARMMNDSVSYFLRAHQVLDGQGLAPQHDRIEHPVGYSIMLVGMIRLGMDNVWWFIGLNFVCLCLTLVLLVPICRAVFNLSSHAIALCIACFLLSWTLVKHLPMLYSELLYCALSFVVLWLLVAVGPQRVWAKAGVFILAVVLTAALISVRTIGLAMLPALGWFLIQQCGGWIALRDRATRSRASKAVSGVLLLVLLGTLVYKVGTYDLDSGSRYVRNMVMAYIETPIESGLRAIDYRLLEFGKLAVNAPERALRMVLPGKLWQLPVYLMGACVLTLLVVGLWQQRRRLTAVHAYLLGYLALQLPWLSYDARFWLPVMPLMLPVMIEPLRSIQRRFPKAARRVGVGYGLAYASVGVLACGAGLYLTSLGRGYAEHDIWFSSELKVAYGLAESDDFEILDLDAVNIIRRYDPYTPAHLRLIGVPQPIPVPFEADPAKRKEQSQ